MVLRLTVSAFAALSTSSSGAALATDAKEKSTTHNGK
jgi:hypothetical protein